MDELKSEQKVKNIISRIMERDELDYNSARTQLHKFVCGGSCGWYKDRKPPERFDKDNLTEEQLQDIKKTVSEIMKDSTEEEARKEIHAVLCHPI